MLGALSTLGLGFILGIQHAFDVDHIAAVSSLASKTKSLKKSSLLGAFWGLGHTTTLLISGILVLLLKITIPEKITLSFEFIVGAVLVLLGVSVVRDAFINKVHAHRHAHDGMEHVHFHSHKDDKEHHHLHRPFFLGLLHGLAGSSALMLLVLATIDSALLGIAYILLFGIGSIFGMLLAGSLVSRLFLFISKIENGYKVLKAALGSISMIIGFNIMVHTGALL